MINWPERQVEKWSLFCLQNCLKNVVTLVDKRTETPEEIHLSKFPSTYHDLAPVFSKRKALLLPPHQPYDCALALLPGLPLPTSQLYNLSGPERESMTNYIEESLDSGIIRPSNSPVGAQFFFVAIKRQDSLTMYIL